MANYKMTINTDTYKCGDAAKRIGNPARGMTTCLR